MSRDPRYDILFDQVKIGPVTAPNRFYAVPHAAGMGDIYPNASAEFRGMKAAGGWGTVCVEMTEISPNADILPYIMPKLFDDSDISYHQRLVEKIKQHGSLAGVEIAHAGHVASNLISREIPVGPSGNPFWGNYPIQSRAMSKSDIKEVLRAQRDAAIRAKRAGYDIIYVYAAHGFGLPQHFISRRHNRRTDEYGGSLENRARLMREMIEVTKDAVGDTCAVAVRFGIEDLLGADGISAKEDGHAVVELLGELPDLWDVNLSDWSNDSITSRFSSEGHQTEYITGIKALTSKPVVGVGRFTSADAMVSLVKKGIVDFIGGARPSIADPYLPNKINENRFDEIRECIGCNICVSADLLHTTIRCTQNPTIGEEWRKDWHPEKIQPKKSDSSVLVVGAGPTGLEAAFQLAKRGYEVCLADAETELGGRVTKEARLPGLSEWIRVKDYRELQLKQMPNVNIYLDNKLSADEVLELGFNHVLLATGSRWRRNAIGRAHYKPLPGHEQANVFTPDDVMDGKDIAGPVVIFDDDHYYMGGVIAEKLALEGKAVTLVTPAALVSSWTENTMEQHRIQARLMEMGVVLKTQHMVDAIEGDSVTLSCTMTGKSTLMQCGALIVVTARDADDALYQELMQCEGKWAAAGLLSVERGGDCDAPATIAAAVYAGHRYARELDEKVELIPYKREQNYR
ncbi:FAD-dependent oxidoreductase [Pseudomonas sp. LABIM340]|uniref:oxidoreductase n=1 Tax=Pseudomonas sp. LABIM340 TaxID=3156585 RepID=UPI0032AF8CF4